MVHFKLSAQCSCSVSGCPAVACFISRQVFPLFLCSSLCTSSRAGLPLHTLPASGTCVYPSWHQQSLPTGSRTCTPRRGATALIEHLHAEHAPSACSVLPVTSELASSAASLLAHLSSREVCVLCIHARGRMRVCCNCDVAAVRGCCQRPLHFRLFDLCEHVLYSVHLSLSS